jgi:hypothetical protein
MGQENSGTDQTHYCRHCLKHRQRPLRNCAKENGGDLAQSKRFPGANTQSRSIEDLAQQTGLVTCDFAPRIWDFAPDPQRQGTWPPNYEKAGRCFLPKRRFKEG